MELDVLKANISLAERVNALQGQLARQERQLQLCMKIITEFEHLLPILIDELYEELDKLGDADVS